MAGFPYHTGSSFIRYPSKYTHDTFGHTGADDVAMGRTGDDVCFRKIPHTGIDISPKKKGDTNAKVVSPVYGTIVATGFDKEAGNWHIIKAHGFAEWWVGGHSSAFVKRSGNVERGEHIAYMGATGGVTGVHVHWSVATSEAAAWDQIKGYINYRNGRSIPGWGASEGLVDPWPLFEREWADEVKRLEKIRLEEERAAAAAAEAAAEAEAEARNKENDMKTRRVQIGNDILVVNVAQGFLWHVPSTAAMPAADVMVDDPKEETTVLSVAAAAALFDALAAGTDSARISNLRARYIKAQ